MSVTVSHPSVDVVIAAHDPLRRVDRAVASALSGSDGEVRVTVVSHGRPASDFTAVLGHHLSDARVRVVEFFDGIRSPAGPFNHGIGLADADYVSIMGSDDFVEEQAVVKWLAHARARRTDYLMPVLRDQGGAVWRDPLTRPRRHERLELVRDRLAYRAAPLGLIRRSVIPSPTPLTPGLETGEDIDLGLRLCIASERIDVGVGLPAYIIGGDAPQRVTLQTRSAAEEFRALTRLSAREWISAAPLRQRRAVAIKLWRMNVIPAIVVRAGAQWGPADLAALEEVARWLEETAPGARGRLSVPEGRIARAALHPTPAGLDSSVAAARGAGPLSRVRTADPTKMLSIDGPLRRVIRLRMPA